MKFCKKCNTTKPISDFSLNNTKKEGLQTFCKNCCKELARVWYEKNKDKKEVKDRYAKHHKENVEKTKLDLDYLKETLGCYICKNEYCACALDFHHINPSDKDSSIAYLRLKKTKIRLEQELKKCIVICSNCHRKLHNNILSIWPKRDK